MRWPGGGLRRSSRSRNGAGSIARKPAAGKSVTRLAWRIVTTREELPIRRNTLLLSASLAANSGTLQLSAAVASLTLVKVLGVKGLLGLGPAIVLTAGALAALPAGRAMDRYGRVPILALGFIVGSSGCGLAALGSATESAPAVLAGLIGVGVASGSALLARTAAGDMYPPEHRAHGIALVLFGAVFGAILGPLVFSPLLHGRELDGDTLALLWLAAGGFMLVALAIVLFVRPDPKRIAELLHTHTAAESAPAAPLSEIVRRPGAIPALLAGQASFAVMVGVMTLTGAVVTDHQHHDATAVFPIIGAHVMGMYALVLVIGELIDRIGRTPALAGGLLVMAVSCSSLLWVESVRGHRGRPVRPRDRLEPVVRGRHRHAGGLRERRRARQAARLQRPARRPHRRRPGAAGRRGAVGDRRRRAGDRRRDAGDPPRGLDSDAPAACTGALVARGSTRAAPALTGPRAPGRRATRRHAAARARSVQGR